MLDVVARHCCAFFACGVLLCTLLAPSPGFALSTNIELEAIARGFERDIPAKGEERVLPGYGYLKFDLKDITSNGISFHGYGWGRYDMGDSKFFDATGDGELLYGYLEYRRKFSTLHLRLGRQHLFEGVANETLDGLWVAGDISKRISLSVYGGQPVALSGLNARSGDSLYGGRVAYHGADLFDLGLSYKMSENDSNTADSMAGLDLSLALPKDMALYGYSKLNVEESGFAEHSWELRIPFDSLTLKPYLQFYDYDNYFATGDKATLPFRNLARSGESLGIAGVDAFWRTSESLNLGAKGKYYTYDQNDSSKYLALTFNLIGEEHTQTGGEIGYMLGDAANNDYLMLRLYTYQDQLADKFWFGFVSADAVYVRYDKQINDKDSSLFLSLGTGKRFLSDRLEVKLSGDYSADPFYSSDIRAMLSATYAFGGGL